MYKDYRDKDTNEITFTEQQIGPFYLTFLVCFSIYLSWVLYKTALDLFSFINLLM